MILGGTVLFWTKYIVERNHRQDLFLTRYTLCIVPKLLRGIWVVLSKILSLLLFAAVSLLG